MLAGCVVFQHLPGLFLQRFEQRNKTPKNPGVFLRETGIERRVSSMNSVDSRNISLEVWRELP
jgi:hypothetical protein